MEAIWVGPVSGYVGPLPPAPPLSAINSYLYNCNRKPYEIPFYVPVKDSSDVQIYIGHFDSKPLSFTAKIVNLCDPTATATVAVCYHVFGVSPRGEHYAVFRLAAGIVLPNLFAIVLDTTTLDGVTGRFFTQGYQLETCVPVTKIEACFPENSNMLGYDTNDIYYGFTTDLANTSGNPGIRYLHFVNVRKAKVFEDEPKLTFSANIRQNFKSVLNRIYELKTELVPAWYKEYLLAVYTRGFIQVNGQVYQVTDLAMEGIDEDDYTWKPYVKLKKETRFYFGCDTTPCNSDCCSPCSASATVETIVTPCCSPSAVSVTIETITPTGMQCGDSYSVEYAGNDYFAHPDQVIGVLGSSVTVSWDCFDRPNRFSVYDNGALLVTSGWVGIAGYPGPWGGSLSTTGSGTIAYTPVAGHEYTLRVEAGPADPDAPITDNFNASIVC